MIINNLVLAAICNDLKHATKYSIDDENKCYYKGKLIGEIKEEYEENDDEIHHYIYFRAFKPIQCIELNFTITPTGVEFKK